MKLVYSLLAALFFSLSCFAQTEIKFADINNHIGDSVKLKAKIYGSKYLSDAKGAPTFINLGAAYPNQLLTVVIWQNVREKLGYNPTDEKYIGGMAHVTGKLELFKGKPQIVISNPDQLKIIYDEEVKFSELPKVDQY